MGDRVYMKERLCYESIISWNRAYLKDIARNSDLNYRYSMLYLDTKGNFTYSVQGGVAMTGPSNNETVRPWTLSLTQLSPNPFHHLRYPRVQYIALVLMGLI